MDLLDSLKVENHLDQRVAILVKNGSVSFDGSIHLCATNEALHKALLSLNDNSSTLQYVEDYLGRALYFALTMDGTPDLIMHGDKDTDVRLGRTQLEGLRPLAVAFRALLAVSEGRMTLSEAIPDISGTTYFYVGNKPDEGSVVRLQDTVKNLTTISVERGEKSIEMVALFLTKEAAYSHANSLNVPLSEVGLVEALSLWSYKMPLCIEYHAPYSVALAPESVLQSVIAKNNNQ
ncbi:MAG: hypothetical protein HUJ96_07365 [Marinilabiliaceae bacterium]|nr:hypothetical protein [Marinilabiliaceae bacterium]